MAGFSQTDDLAGQNSSATPFAAEFGSGFGLMLLDISIGAIFAAVIPDTLKVPGDRRVPGRQLRHPAGRRAARGLIGAAIGLRPALWIATLGGIAGFFLLLPTPLPRYRLPASAPGG